MGAASALLSYQTLPVTTSARRSWRLKKIVTLTRDVASARMEASVLTTSVQLGQPLLLPLLQPPQQQLQPPLLLPQFHVLRQVKLVSVFPQELSEIAALARALALFLKLALGSSAIHEQFDDKA